MGEANKDPTVTGDRILESKPEVHFHLHQDGKS